MDTFQLAQLVILVAILAVTLRGYMTLRKLQFFKAVQARPREVLPLSSGKIVRPGESVLIKARSQRVPFDPERLFVASAGTSGGAADWIIEDVKIGNRSQFAQTGDIPGDMFAATAIDGFVTWETAFPTMDVAVIAKYVGPNKEGVPFYGAMVGRDASDPKLRRKPRKPIDPTVHGAGAN